MKKKKITIDTLAGMVQRGFIDQADSFDNKLKNFATKDDLKNFATRDDLKNLKTELKEELLGGIDTLLNKADRVLDKFDKINQEEIVHTSQHKKISETLEIHETRIGKLELKKT